jgi:hypothetical protein
MPCTPPLFLILCIVLHSSCQVILSIHPIEQSQYSVLLLSQYKPITIHDLSFESIALCVYRDQIHLSGLHFDAACSLLSRLASIPTTRQLFAAVT